MATKAVAIDHEHVLQILQQARKQLERAEGELVLDFSAVRRIDAQALEAMESLAGAAQEKSVKLVLRGVSVDVYKVLKLMRLAPRFGFVN